MGARINMMLYLLYILAVLNIIVVIASALKGKFLVFGLSVACSIFILEGIIEIREWRQNYKK